MEVRFEILEPVAVDFVFSFYFQTETLNNDFCVTGFHGKFVGYFWTAVQLCTHARFVFDGDGLCWNLVA